MNGFQTHKVDNLGEVGPFSEWLMDCGRRDEQVAVAVRERQKKIAFSTREDAWVVDLKSIAAPFAMGVLRTQIIDHGQIKMAARDLYSDLIDLSKTLAPLLWYTPNTIFQSLAPAFVADLSGAARAINQSVTPKTKFRLIEHDAYEVALLEPQFAYDIAPYYFKVSIPFAKLQAEASLNKHGEPDWWVTYNNLWLKVLAYYTNDPTLTWALMEGRDPIQAIHMLLKSESLAQAEALLLWQTCGRDMDCFTKRFPTLVSVLPDNLIEFGNRFDNSLPALSAACTQMKEAYTQSRTVETLYNRKLRPNNPVGEAVAFRVFGTVEDIIGVCAVAFWQARPSSDILISYFDGDLGTTRIGGNNPRVGKETWTANLKALSPLAHPLGASLALNPIVTVR